MSKKVSVIVPVYNVEKYLPKCLDSLVNQTLEDIEILVVNDGSPDNSQAIIDDYAARYPEKIRAFVKENGGLSDARNFAVPHATGEYIAFVDSDDYVDLDMYEQMYGKAAEANADVVCCPTTYEYPTKTLKVYFAEDCQFGKPASEIPQVLKRSSSFAWNKIYRKSFWIDNGFKYPKNQHFEDSATTYGVMLKANILECVNIPFYHYVKERDGSITNTFDTRVFDIFLSCDSMLASAKPYWDHNDDLRENIIYVCIRHIWARVKDMAKSEDVELLKEYLKKAYAYMDEKLPGWKEIFDKLEKPGKNNLKAKVQKFLFLHKPAAFLYYGMKKKDRRKLDEIYKKLKEIKAAVKKSCKDTLLKVREYLEKRNIKIKTKRLTTNEKKRIAVQTFGMELIEFVQDILMKENIRSFADFGTLLGIIREGKLLAHDLDADIGVILNDPMDIHRVRIAMERNGFKLWRRYVNGEQVVEESYLMKDLKVDLNFYQMGSDYAKTWLFYTKPGYQYEEKYHRHIVEMTYSPIGEMKTINVNGCNIAIPENAEQLLEEKYGKTWRTPDKGWIYWQSPAATPIDGIGRFFTFSYSNFVYRNEKWLSIENRSAR